MNCGKATNDPAYRADHAIHGEASYAEADQGDKNSGNEHQDVALPYVPQLKPHSVGHHQREANCQQGSCKK